MSEEEKKAIIMVGAEKVKQLEKEIEELKQNRDEYKEEYIKLQNARYYNYISKDKIREKIKEARKIRWHIPNLVIEYFEELLEEK